MDTDRVESFSDGVFAFAITVLVLAIGVPDLGAPLGPALLRLGPSYVAYGLSFLVIGAIWINHHTMFRHIVRADAWILILNLLQLMLIAFLPFPTAVLARSFLGGTDESIATSLYGGTLLVLGLAVTGTWMYAARDHRLLDDRISPEKAKRISRRYLVGPTSYAIAVAVGLVVPVLAVAIFLLINLFFLWPRPTPVTPAPEANAKSA